MERWQHPSGAQVAWVSAPGIPMVDIRLEFDGGARRDPPDAAGLAAAAAGLSQRGVAANPHGPSLDENQLAERWLDLGAQWSVSAGADRLSAQLRSLTEPSVLGPAIDLAAQALAFPAFSGTAAEQAVVARVWQRERERLITAWQAQQVQPATAASIRFQSAVYGDHPYGAVARPETWQRIDLQAVQGHWARHVQACRARVTVVGDVTGPQVQLLVQRLLAPLAGASGAPGTPAPEGQNAPCPALPPVPEVRPLAAAADIRIPMATAQSHVLLGQPGHPRRDPDFFPLMLGNYILGGGGFVSRLTTEVREQRGLANSTYSYFAPGEHAGAFTVGLQTRPDQANQALALAHDVVSRFVNEGPTDAELKAAQDFMVNGFALRIDSNRKLLDNVANMLWYDLPPDYLQTWPQRIQAVTAQDVQRAMARVLQPHRMVTVVVGPESGSGIR